MKRVFTSILITAFILGSVFAIDYGGLVISDSTLKQNGTQKFVFAEQVDASAYLKVPFSQDGSTVLSTEFAYRFQYDNSQASNFINLSLLKINHTRAVSDGQMTIAGGRYIMADGTGKIFNQTSDGLFASHQTSTMVGSMYFGYTGLVNSFFTSMNVAGVTGEYTRFKSDMYTFTLPYLVVGAEFALPNLFYQQNLSFGSWNFFGTQKLKSNKIYGTISLNGPLMENLYHNTHVVLAGILGDRTTNFAGLAASNLTYYFNYMGLAANAGLTYASKEFQTVTNISGLVTGESWSNLFVPTVSVSMLPLSALYVAAETNVALRADGMKYEGIGLAAVASYQLFNDVAFSLNASTFIAKEETARQTKISLKAAISF